MVLRGGWKGQAHGTVDIEKWIKFGSYLNGQRNSLPITISMLLCAKRIADGLVRIINFDDHNINRLRMNCIRNELTVDKNYYQTLKI